MNKRKRPPGPPEFKPFRNTPRAQKKAMLTKRNKTMRVTLAQPKENK